MALIARKLQGAAQDRIRSFVAQHAQALEPGLSVLETSLRLGRGTIDVIALDAKQTLVLVVAGEVADEKMLISTLDAYIWCLTFPDNLRRLYPTAPIALTRPPRLIFVAERVPDSFLELVERLSVVNVECQELSIPGAAPAEGPVMIPHELPLAPMAPVAPPVPVAPSAPVVPLVPVMPVTPVIAAPVVPVSPVPMPTPSRRLEQTPVAAGFDAAVAQQWENFLSNGSNGHGAPGSNGSHSPNGAHSNGTPVANGHVAAAAAPVEVQPSVPSMAEAPVNGIIPPVAVAGQWPPVSPALSNGHLAASNGHTNGHSASMDNGHAPVAATAAPQLAPNSTLIQAMHAAEASIEHAAVDLGVRIATPPAPSAQPEAEPQPPVMAPQPAVEAPPPAAAAPPQPARSPFKSPAPAPTVKPVAKNGADDSPVSHPALESLKFPKGGVSRQWQDFLDQLAAANR
jgi:hypothetical protein